MRKIFIVMATFMLISSIAIAGTFAPTPMMLTSSDVISYAFNGSQVDIPVSLTGTSALMRFSVFTKNKADQIIDIKNGHLGWHYMNKIDTCIYLSGEYHFQPGSDKITWDGKDNDGGIVPPGEYTFYLWGFDNMSPRIIAEPRAQGYGSNDDYLIADEQGNLLANPIHYMGHNDMQKWIIGSDPEDDALYETCSIVMPEGFRSAGSGSELIPDHDWSFSYHRFFNSNTLTSKALKFSWVPNDMGTQDTDFDVSFSQLNAYTGSEYQWPYAWYGECNYKEAEAVRTYMHIVDLEAGEYIGYIDHTDFFEDVADYQTGGAYGLQGGWTQSTFNDDKGYMIGGCHCCCIRVCFEPSYYFEDPDDTVRWVNDQGDYFWDLNWETTAQYPWLCNSLIEGMSNHGFGSDQHVMIEAEQYWGSTSFNAALPDGTALGNYSYAGEIDQAKGGGTILDVVPNGAGAFDGAYVVKTGSEGNEPGTFWIARDSFMGTITSSVGVEEEAPAAFSVAQNSPNPFNPTTTISLSLAEAGNVTIDVFNAAGQKVDTLVDGFREAGSQSVVWDASDFSAGVYFCTVRSDDFSKTVKMTLLK